MIIIFTGDGKGKTTAALGVALRSSGWGNRVAIIQFIKGNKNIGEWKAIHKIKEIDIFQFLDDDQLYIGQPEPRHRETITKILSDTRELASSGKYNLIVLDEVNNAIKHKLVGANEIIDIIRKYPKIDFILTGRSVNSKLLKIADVVTEMKKIKHPYDHKIKAKKGIDY